MLKDANPTMADVPSPPPSPRRRGLPAEAPANATPGSGGANPASKADGAVGGGVGGVKVEPGASAATGDSMPQQPGGKGDGRGGGVDGSSRAVSVGAGQGKGDGAKEEAGKEPEATRCDFCGDDELSLCSTMVEGTTWEEELTRAYQTAEVGAQDRGTQGGEDGSLGCPERGCIASRSSGKLGLSWPICVPSGSRARFAGYRVLSDMFCSLPL